MTPIQADGANGNARTLNEDTAAEELLKGLLPPDYEKKKPVRSEPKPEPKAVVEDDSEDEDESDGVEAEDSEDDVPGTEDDDADDADEGDDEDPKERKYADDEGAYLKIKVDGEEKEVPIKDLKRLWGQEAALTRRSQEVATRRTQLDTEGAQYVAASQAMVARAQERYAPYANIDFLALSRDPDITTEELTALRQEAQRAYEDVQFLTSEQQNFLAETQRRQHTAMVERAKESIKELTDPEKGIPGWNEKLYDDVRTYAIKVGIPAETVNKMVEPSALRIIHKAMMYDRGKSKVVTTKVNKTPKRVVKTTTSPASRPTKAKAFEAKMAKLRQTGSTDAAADVFLATLTRGHRDED